VNPLFLQYLHLSAQIGGYRQTGVSLRAFLSLNKKIISENRNLLSGNKTGHPTGSKVIGKSEASGIDL